MMFSLFEYKGKVKMLQYNIEITLVASICSRGDFC